MPERQPSAQRPQERRRGASPQPGRDQTPPGAARILALQGRAGNRAIARTIAAARIPGQVRGQMERAFGSSFEDVRMHLGSPEAAGLGAQALTQGSDVHVAARSFDPGSERDRTLLGHELAHVVQQRQGRVGPTGELDGVALNRDPGLEGEADAQGTRAARGEPTGAAPTRPVSAGPTVAQAKFGFEFQTANSFVEHKRGKEMDPHAELKESEDDIPIVGEKQLAFEDTTRKFKVEGDEGADAKHFDVEFITAALATASEAKIAVEGAADLAKDLAKGNGIRTRERGDAFGSGAWTRPVALEVTDTQFHAKPQASVGVGLADIPALLAENLGGGDRAIAEQAAAVMRGQRWRGASPKWRVSGELLGFLSIVLYYIRAAGSRNPVDRADPDSFPTLGYQVIISDGPKAMFSIMARTDFHSMFKALPKGDQLIFTKALLGDAEKPDPDFSLDRIIGADLRVPIIRDPYRADKMADDDREQFPTEMHTNLAGEKHEIVLEGPTILDWLLSIVTGDSHKNAKSYAPRYRDMLSAPVGLGSRKWDATGFPTGEEIVAEQIYGMGAYPIDEPGSAKPLAIFEIRSLDWQLGNWGLPAADNWWRAAEWAMRNSLRPGVPQPPRVRAD